MTDRLLVYGAGGHGKVVADVARSAGWDVIGFIDDRATPRGAVFGLPVRGWEELLSSPLASPGLAIALGIGDPRARQRCYQQVLAQGFRLPTLIHARAVVAPTARLGPGTVVMALAVVNPDAVVGDAVILNTACVVEHDCHVGHYAHLSPNAALGGAVNVGKRTHLGLGAVAIPGVRIGDDVIVGAGAVVIRDVPGGVTVVGVPAHSIDTKKGTES